MAGRWKEVVRLRFKGDRFRDHALDLGALSELSQFQKLVAETAKEMWRAANPDRERIPRHFEERTRLCLRRIEEGSATTPLEVYMEEEQAEFWETEPTEAKEAVNLAYEVFDAANRDSELPERFPRKLLTEFATWGQCLAENEEIEIQTADLRLTPITPKTRESLTAFCEPSHEAQVDVAGEVLEADVKQRHFQLWLTDRSHVSVSFSESQEGEVTTALRDHNQVRMKVKGRGVMSPQGRLLRITRVDEITIQPVGEPAFDENARPIEEILAELASEVPHAEWEKLPVGLSDDLDHYLYGTPKR